MTALSNQLMRKSSVTVVALAMCCWTTADAAGYLRCHGKLIRPGVSAAYILAICGPPERQLIQQVPARARTVTGLSRLTGIAVSEQWILGAWTSRLLRGLSNIDMPLLVV